MTLTWRPKRRVKPEGKVRWVARYLDPVTGKERIARPAWNGRKGTFDLRKDAQRAIDEAVSARMPERASTVEAYVEDRWLRMHPRSERTTKNYDGRVRNVRDLKLDGLELRNWDLREQDTACSARRAALFGEHQVDEVIHLVTLSTPQKDARTIRVWSWQEMHHFASSASYRPKRRTGRPKAEIRRAPEYEGMLRVIADCGPRIGEVFAMQRYGLDLNLEELVVKGSLWEGRLVESSEEKDHDRALPLPPGCVQVLGARPPRIDTAVLFPTPRGKAWLYSNFIAQVWEPTCEVAGIEPLPHEFRHSWNTHLRAAGIDPADLAQVGGHTIETGTKHYTHALGRSDDRIRKAIG